MKARISTFRLLSPDQFPDMVSREPQHPAARRLLLDLTEQMPRRRILLLGDVFAAQRAPHAPELLFDLRGIREGGIHRLVRISPFDANARRHTSFASVYVYPVLDDTIEVDIKPEDLRVDTYRAGGKGGQHVNKTDSAVRFTHIPTGIVVACQTERSQLMNRQTCMNMLKARLYEYYREQKEKENSKFMAEKKDISFGSQIRSYVFCPYTMVKDHRTRHSVGNIQAVMDGDLDDFMNAYLVAKWKGLPMDGSGDDDDEV